jgi:hypothetical protein
MQRLETPFLNREKECVRLLLFNANNQRVFEKGLNHEGAEKLFVFSIAAQYLGTGKTALGKQVLKRIPHLLKMGLFESIALKGCAAPTFQGSRRLWQGLRRREFHNHSGLAIYPTFGFTTRDGNDPKHSNRRNWRKRGFP